MNKIEVIGFPQACLKTPKAHPAAVVFGKGVFSGITTHAVFTNQPGAVAQLKQDADAYDQAEVVARGKGSVAVKARNAARRRMIATLKLILPYVQSVAEAQGSNADASEVIASAGLYIKKVTPRHKPPVNAKYGPNTGSVVLEAKAVAKEAVYFWQTSVDGKVWVDQPQTLKTKLLVTGLTPGQTYYFRFRAHTRKGDVDYSQVVSLLVH